MRAYFQATLVLAPAWSTSFEALGRADLSRRLDRVVAPQFKSCSALHSARAGFPGRNMRSYAIDDSHHLHHARPERAGGCHRLLRSQYLAVRDLPDYAKPD